ncbi:MAG: RICIN domain-containing protein [Bacteroidota bacterium]|nr:RICIN domain-containing protein [Bacteroidota bacterium]
MRVNSFCTIFALAILLLSSVAVVSCDRRLDDALDMAGDNRVELEKVLRHYEEEGDTLKYNAAKFLIENMPYRYSYSGACLDSLDKAYLDMSEAAKEFRDSVFKARTGNIDLASKTLSLDILSLSAKQLISAIDDACDLWRKVNWSKEYSQELFFDYVLPYRLLNEQMSNWRKAIKNEFPSLSSYYIVSRSGHKVEAEEARIGKGKITDAVSASNGKMVLIDSHEASVSFDIENELPCRKMINLRYTSVEHGNYVTVMLNGKRYSEMQLAPTPSLNVFQDSPKGLMMQLPKGKNTITIKYDKGVVGIDYSVLSAIESYSPAALEDYSAHYCRISNRQSGNAITFDTLQSSVLDLVKLKKVTDSDSCGMLRLDYLGETFWTIKSFRKDTTDLCLEVRYCLTDDKAPIAQYNYLNGNHQRWAILPAENGYVKIMNKLSGLFLESTTDEDGNEIIIQTSYSGKKSQMWSISRLGHNPYCKLNFKIGDRLSEAMRVYGVCSQFSFFPYEGIILPKLSSLMTGKTGNCREEASYIVTLCRYLGIPSAVDFTPNWGNRSQSHSWSVIINPDGKATPFYMGCVPGDTTNYSHIYRKPKIYRHRFQLNRQISEDMIEEKEVPPLFVAPDFIDVTDEYIHTTDVERSVPDELRDGRIAYICVYDNQSWKPVHYGRISGGKVLFTSMGRNILYITGTYKDGKICPFGMPFIIEENGKMCDVSINMRHRENLTLLRKYPFFGREDFFNFHMSGGRFQGANRVDFSDAVDLFKHEGITDGNWCEADINENRRFNYLRYIGPNGSRCNINELEFYSKKGTKISGTIIGTEGEAGHTKETVFDGDILTGFSGNSPDGHWVGLKLSTPEVVGKLRYIPRNDGNSIEIGNTYELLYWSQGKWVSFGKLVAKSNSVTFTNVPSGGLYLLKNLTKGHEERIFTYEKGNQIWW